MEMWQCCGRSPNQISLGSRNQEVIRSAVFIPTSISVRLISRKRGTLPVKPLVPRQIGTFPRFSLAVQIAVVRQKPQERRIQGDLLRLVAAFFRSIDEYSVGVFESNLVGNTCDPGEFVKNVSTASHVKGKNSPRLTFVSQIKPMLVHLKLRKKAISAWAKSLVRYGSKRNIVGKRVRFLRMESPPPLQRPCSYRIPHRNVSLYKFEWSGRCSPEDVL